MKNWKSNALCENCKNNTSGMCISCRRKELEDEMLINMPQEKEWKKELEKMWHVVSYGDMISFIELTLSSQAHALKEQMKACVPEKEGNWDEVYEAGFNDCREKTLSAFNEIDI